MRIAISGATGLIGSHLLPLLRSAGHEIRVLSRRAATPATFAWNPLAAPPPEESLAGASAVIHLAGEPVAQRWSPKVKQLIRESRVTGTTHLVEGLARLAVRPEVLISASAVGFYGSRGDEELTEESSPGQGFLPETCVAWEAAARKAEALGIRVVLLRIGVVLSPDGGALAKMLPPFRAGVGGPIAGGRMWMPWIHAEDLARLIVFTLENREASGAWNAVGPNPVRNSEFTAALAHALKRPAFLPVPSFSLRLLYGEMAEVVLGSQKVIPARALQAGFAFRFATIDEAFRNLFRPKA